MEHFSKTKKRVTVAFGIFLGTCIVHYLLLWRLVSFVTGVSNWQFDNPYKKVSFLIRFLERVSDIFIQILFIPSTLLVKLGLVSQSWEMSAIFSAICYGIFAALVYMIISLRRSRYSSMDTIPN